MGLRAGWIQMTVCGWRAYGIQCTRFLNNCLQLLVVLALKPWRPIPSICTAFSPWQVVFKIVYLTVTKQWLKSRSSEINFIYMFFTCTQMHAFVLLFALLENIWSVWVFGRLCYHEEVLTMGVDTTYIINYISIWSFGFQGADVSDFMWWF